MVRYIHVLPKFASWLQKALKEYKKPLVGAGVGFSAGEISQFLKKNNVPHGLVDSEEKVPAGHHYHRTE